MKILRHTAAQKCNLRGRCQEFCPAIETNCVRVGSGPFLKTRPGPMSDPARAIGRDARTKSRNFSRPLYANHQSFRVLQPQCALARCAGLGLCNAQMNHGAWRRKRGRVHIPSVSPESPPRAQSFASFCPVAHCPIMGLGAEL